MTPFSNIAIVGIPLIGKAVSIPLIAAVGVPLAVGVGATLAVVHLLDDDQEEKDE